MDEKEIQYFLQHNFSVIVPSEENVEEFILEFQRRQRIALMTPTFWQSIRENLHYIFSEMTIPPLAYASVTAVAFLISVLIITGNPSSQKFYFADYNHNSSQNSPWRYNGDTSAFLEKEVHPASYSEGESVESSNPLNYFFHQMTPGGRNIPQFISL
jgi:hypothetical protein